VGRLTLELEAAKKSLLALAVGPAEKRRVIDQLHGEGELSKPPMLSKKRRFCVQFLGRSSQFNHSILHL